MCGWAGRVFKLMQSLQLWEPEETLLRFRLSALSAVCEGYVGACLVLVVSPGSGFNEHMATRAGKEKIKGD